MSFPVNGSIASRRDWTGKVPILTPRSSASPLKPSGSLMSWDFASQKLGSALGPSSLSSSSSFRTDFDEGMNFYGVTSYVPRSAFLKSSVDVNPNQESKKMNECSAVQLAQIQQIADEYKEEAATSKFHADALKAELEALQNQHQALMQSSADALKLEIESANAQHLKSQLESENLRQNLAALQTKVVESFMVKWRLFHKKNVLFRIMKCWRTLSKIESEANKLHNSMLEHQASNFWKRLLRCRSKQLILSWKFSSFFEKCRLEHHKKACSSRLLMKIIFDWRKNSAKRARDKSMVISAVVKRDKDSVLRMILAWRRVFCHRAIATAQLRKKVELVLMSDVVRKWITTNLKNAFVFRNFTLCSQKFMLIAQRTAFAGWMMVYNVNKSIFMEQQRDEAQEILRVSRIKSKCILVAFSAWTRSSKQHREMNSKSRCFRETKLAFWPIKIQRHCLNIWFASTQIRLQGTSFKLATLVRGTKVLQSRKIQECLKIVFEMWKSFHTSRLHARINLQKSRLLLLQKSFDLWNAFSCRECLLSFKSNGLVQRSILVRRFSKVGTAGRLFSKWRRCVMKIRRKRRFAVFVSRLFKKGDKNTIVSHFLVWASFCKDERKKMCSSNDLKRKVIKVWSSECKICACLRRRQLKFSWRAWITFTNDRCFLQMRSAVEVLIRILSRRHPSHLSIAIETSILKSKSFSKLSAFKPFCTWAIFVEMQRSNSLHLSIFLGKWRIFARCSAKIRSAVVCASKSFQRSKFALLKQSVDHFFISMTLSSAVIAKDARISRNSLFNCIFELLRHQKQRLSLTSMPVKSKLHQTFSCWKSFSTRNSTGKWLLLQFRLHSAVQRLRSWTRRMRVCAAANQFVNRVSRSMLSFVVDSWKRTVLIRKKRVLEISSVCNRLIRTALHRLLLATVTAWRLLSVSKSKLMPAINSTQSPQLLSERRSSARRIAIWKDLNSSSDSDVP